MPEVVKETTFKGWPVLEFADVDKNGGVHTFTLGVRKLALIDDNIDTVRRFIDKHDPDSRNYKRANKS